MSTRRHDPDRRERIIDAALQVIATQGLAGCTHRSVAAQSGVPLGSMTYHFESRDDLILQAFERLSQTARNPQARALMTDWMAGAQAELQRWFDATTTRALDATIEGIILHNAYSDGAIDRAQVQSLLQRVAGLAM